MFVTTSDVVWVWGTGEAEVWLAGVRSGQYSCATYSWYGITSTILVRILEGDAEKVTTQACAATCPGLSIYDVRARRGRPCQHACARFTVHRLLRNWCGSGKTMISCSE